MANVHRRDSTGNLGYKPTVKCATQPIAVSLKNELQKHMILGIWKTEHTDLYLLKAADLRRTTYRDGFTYKNVDKKCDNNLSTQWKGKTSSTIKATNGIVYYARQYTNEAKENCGT